MKNIILLAFLFLSSIVYSQNTSTNYIQACDSILWNNTWFYDDTVASFSFQNTVNGIQESNVYTLSYDFIINNDALFVGESIIQLTDAMNLQAGSAWHMNQLDLSSSFSFNISLFFDAVTLGLMVLLSRYSR